MKFKLKPLSLAVTIAVLIFGGIAISDILNYWRTESAKVPAKYTSGEYEGAYNPADIRGSYTFLDVCTNFEIPIEHLAAAFGLSESVDVNSYQCKNLEADYAMAAERGFEIGTDSVRIFVALYKGLPIELKDTYIPDDAYQILKDNASLTEEQIDYLDSHTVNMSNLEAVQITEAPDSEVKNSEAKEAAPANTVIAIPTDAPQKQESGTKGSGDYNSEDKLIKGKTTFAELLGWGVTKEEIVQALGTDMPNAALSVRDFCSQQRIEFSAIKEKLQSIVDKKQPD